LLISTGNQPNLDKGRIDIPEPQVKRLFHFVNAPSAYDESKGETSAIQAQNSSSPKRLKQAVTRSLPRCPVAASLISDTLDW
jgi:hypothetical protein